VRASIEIQKILRGLKKHKYVKALIKIKKALLKSEALLNLKVYK